ncbi:MAG: DUF1467 family protein [Sphingobium sp.]
MNSFAIFAIYLLFWVISAFILLPIGIRTPNETGEKLVPGQAESAPSNFRPRRVIIGATLASLVLFGLYYASYVNDWISQDTLIHWSIPS